MYTDDSYILKVYAQSVYEMNAYKKVEKWNVIFKQQNEYSILNVIKKY